MPEKLEYQFTSNIPEFEKDDVHMVNRWKAHQDLINHITYVPDLKVIATCSFDCNVSMWDRKTSIIEKEDRIVRTNKRVGSLLLGTGHAQQSEQTEAERRRYANAWKIKIDKLPKLIEKRVNAEEILEQTQTMDYETMFLKASQQREALES